MRDITLLDASDAHGQRAARGKARSADRRGVITRDDPRRHHRRAFAAGDAGIAHRLAFRDHSRDHPAIAAVYAAFMRAAAARRRRDSHSVRL
ncbi:GrpB family protein [Pantoea sp. 1.19]|uniref:GrpB family protein n=1 Tax=Pantoea sp. 1.19 TaxID=1925589 RepID=UPI00094911F6